MLNYSSSSWWCCMQFMSRTKLFKNPLIEVPGTIFATDGKIAEMAMPPFWAKYYHPPRLYIQNCWTYEVARLPVKNINDLLTIPLTCLTQKTDLICEVSVEVSCKILLIAMYKELYVRGRSWCPGLSPLLRSSQISWY